MRNCRERDGLVEDPEQREDPGQSEELGRGGETVHIEDTEQLGQGDETGQVEETGLVEKPEQLVRLVQDSGDDAPAYAPVDSEIIRDRIQDLWEFLVEYADFQWDDLDLGGQNDVEEATTVETAVGDTSREGNDANGMSMTHRHP